MKDVNQHLEQAINGKPQLKADEKAQYLDQLKERLLLSATLNNITDPNFINNIESYIKEKNAHLYIHGKLMQNIQNQLIQLALKYNRQFTIVKRDNEIVNDTIILVYAEQIATHVDEFEYSTLFSNNDSKISDTATKENKQSLLKKLFNLN